MNSVWESHNASESNVTLFTFLKLVYLSYQLTNYHPVEVRNMDSMCPIIILKTKMKINNVSRFAFLCHFKLNSQ